MLPTVEKNKHSKTSCVWIAIADANDCVLIMSTIADCNNAKASLQNSCKDGSDMDISNFYLGFLKPNQRT